MIQAFFLGLNEALIQIILLREMISIFHGNELSYAVIWAVWLGWIGVGSFLAEKKFFHVPATRPLSRESLLFLLSVFLIVSIFAVRGCRIILGIHPGAMMGILPMIVVTICILSPVGLLCGGVYTILCRHQESEQIRRIYLWESIGCGLSGIVFSFFLIAYFSHWQIAVGLCAVNLWFWFFYHARKQKTRNWSAGVLIIIFTLFLFATVSTLDQWMRRIQWMPLSVINTRESKYGNLIIARQGETQSVFENGVLSVTAGDTLASEVLVHFSLPQLERVSRVLLIGSGLTMLPEVLKYPVEQIDYVELDAALIQLLEQTLSRESVRIFHDPRVRIIFDDARHWVKVSGQKYEAVILAIGDPYNMMQNRYYTEEFFKEIRAILADHAIFTFGVTSSENYWNDSNLDFLRSLNSTLQTVFPDVASAPGEMHVFWASPSAETINIEPEFLAEQLTRQKILARYVLPETVLFLLDPWRRAESNKLLAEPGEINRDFHPTTYLFDLTLWSTHFGGEFDKILSVFRKVSVLHMAGLLVALVGGLFFVNSASSTFSVSCAVFMTGFSEMLFQILIIMAFQAIFGFAYFWIGAIMGMFMLGLVAGASCIRGRFGSIIEQQRLFFLVLQVGMCLYFLFLPFIFRFFRDNVIMIQNRDLAAVVFLMLPFTAAMIAGAQYPLAVGIHRAEQKQTAGSLYALDAWGAMAGAAVAGLLWIPIYGLDQTVGLGFLMNILVVMILIRKRR